MGIARALHELEAVAAKHKTPKRVMTHIGRLHRVLHEAACEHADDLGLVVQPLSGGTPKPEDP
jgi:hypothetical protein